MSLWDTCVKVFPSSMCCFATKVDETESQPATLRTLRPTSPASIALPNSAVPHSNSVGADGIDAQVLREIFTSASSIRGYQAAVAPNDLLSGRSTFFDAAWQMPERPSPSKKHTTKLSLVGHQIKQKLSEARLSKSSSKPSVKDKEHHLVDIPLKKEHRTDDQPLLLAFSNRSTGLSDILRSRSASEGGYDSDARSIETAMLRSNPGTLRLGSRPVNKLVDISEMSKDTASKETQEVDGIVTAPTTSETPLSAHHRSKSAPTPPSSTSFTDALLVESKESPGQYLRRISIGLTNGSIIFPATAELKALQLPCLDSIGPGGALGRSTTPFNTESRSKDIQILLQALSEKLDQARRTSLVASTVSEKRISLISDLDPNIIELIDACPTIEDADAIGPLDHTDSVCLTTDAGERLLAEESGVANAVVPQPYAKADQGFTDYVGTSARNSTLSLEKSIGESLKSDSGPASLHLYNVRISQKLASNSAMPVLSQADSGLKSVTSGRLLSQRHTSVGRYPSFISQEHTRRPSDPQTRKLFESIGQGKKSSVCRSFTSIRHLSPTGTGTNLRTEGSSLYPSDTSQLGASPRSSLAVSRKSSFRNPNSLAVGGRSASGGIPHSYSSISQLSNAEENAWLRRTPVLDQRPSHGNSTMSQEDLAYGRGRSVSLPKTSCFTEEVGTPTPKRRQQIQVSSADSDEHMSEVSVNGVIDRRNEMLTEESADRALDRRDENLSEVETGRGNLRPPTLETRRYSGGWLSQGRRGGWGFEVLRTSQDQARKPSHDSVRSIQLPETATGVWERALKRAREDHTSEECAKYKNFLHVPAGNFDRHGRKRSRTNSTLSVGSSKEQSRQQQTRSRSEDRQSVIHTSILQDPATSGAEFYAEASSLTGGKDTRHRSNTLREGLSKKRSDINLRRNTTTGTRFQKDKPKNSARKVLRTWTGFPSHTREARNRPAGSGDNVKTRDFQLRDADDRPFTATQFEEKNKSVLSLLGILGRPSSRSNADLELLQTTPDSRRRGSLRGRRKTGGLSHNTGSQASTTPMSRSTPTRKHTWGSGRGRPSILHALKRLYRNSNSELRQRRMTSGQRSSIAIADRVEYPELELLPGEGLMGGAIEREEEERRRRSELQGFGMGTNITPATTMGGKSVYADAKEHLDESDRTKREKSDGGEGSDDQGPVEFDTPTPAFVKECRTGKRLGEKGSCEDIAVGNLAGVDGTVADRDGQDHREE